jgi:hypothetical protein
VETRVWTCGICGGQSGAVAGFLRVYRIPLSIFIPPIALQSLSSIIWGWYNRPLVAAVPSGLSLTPVTIIKSSKYGRSLFKPIWRAAGLMANSSRAPVEYDAGIVCVTE